MPTGRDPFTGERFREGTGETVEGFLDRIDTKKLRDFTSAMVAMKEMMEATSLAQVSGTFESITDMMQAPFTTMFDTIGMKLEEAFNPLIFGVLNPLLNSGLFDQLTTLMTQISTILQPALEGLFNILNFGLSGITGGIENLQGGGTPAVLTGLTAGGTALSGAAVGGIVAGPIGIVAGGIIGGLAGLFLGGFF